MTYYYCFNKTEEQDPAMKALRMMGYDMFVPGNHEFNYGMKILQSRLEYLTSEKTETEAPVAVGCANYLAAETNNDETKDWATWNGYAPYQLYNYDGVTGEGFYYEIDPSKPEGDRVTMTYNGVAVKDDDTFTVVVNNYRYNGGGNYVKYLNDHGCEFKANDPDRIVYSTQYDMIQGEDKGQARNLLADYITEQETINPADYTIANWKIVGAK